jgi:basic membrane protein A and related proteins
MSGFDLDRRKVLEGMGALGASALQTALPIRLARAGQLVAGFVYIGPRLGLGLERVPCSGRPCARRGSPCRVVQADYLPESTNYGSGKDDAQTRAYSEAMERLISGGGARLVISTSFDDDPFLLAMAKKHPYVAFRQASNFANSASPPNVGSQNALINQGHYVNGVAAGLCTRTDKLGFVAGMSFGAVLLNVNSFLIGVRQTNPQKGGTLPNYVIGGYDKDYVRSSPFGAGATPEAIVAATTAIQAMKNQDAIFAGPIKDNTGKIVVPAGTVYGPYDEALLKTDYLVEGLIGTLP